MSEGGRSDDGKHSEKMMDGGKKRYGDGNKHATADTKLSCSEWCNDGKKHAATDTKLSSVEQDIKTRSRWSFERRRGMAATSPLKLMVWIIIASFIQLVQCGYITVDVTTDEFNHNEHPHAKIFGIIYEIAADALPRLEVQGHRYLAPKDPQPRSLGGDGSGPARWIKVPFRGDRDDDRATIALADHDLSLLAFMNNIGTWHCFKGYEDMFPNCVVLNSGLDERGQEWDETYANLIEGGVENLHTVPLGKNSDKESTSMLGHYRHDITPLPELKQALVRKKIMYSEALKVRLVRETFSGALWETETYLSEAPEQASRIQHWGYISYLLWRSDRGGQFLRDPEDIRVGQEIGITRPQEALDAYDLLRVPQAVRIKVPPK